jgi:succinate-semialdehyde dehydrogenase/glutarate-semialdehyde dehydrogenase
VWQVVRFAAPALAAGNTVLLKHAPIVTGTALAIESIVREAGLPEGCLQVLILPDERVAEVIDDERVAAVTLTGSVRAGAAVASRAGAAIKKTVLELGGSDPFVVLDDADLDRAADTAVRARMQNTGQSCIAAKRLIVARAVEEPFVSRLAARIGALVTGDPLDERTDLGPLARADLRATLERQLDESLRRGARLVLGGRRPDRPGFFFEPTLVTGAGPGMPVADDETFGPLAVVFSVDDEEEAVRAANRTRYGLGASVWSADAERGRALALRLDAGCVFVNGMVRSDPRLPFGGIKRSGYGRELGREGIREFVNARTVVVD